MAEFVMPSLGADMKAGTLVQWRCAVGDHLRRGDIIAEVETEKGVIEVEVFVDGVVERLLVEPGTKVPVGTPLALLGEPGRAAPPPSASEEKTERAGPAPPSPSESRPPLTAASSEVRPERPAVATVAYVGEAPPPGRSTRATPKARRLALERGVDLASMRAPGAGAPITPEEVERAHQERVAAEAHADAGRRPISPAARRRAQGLGLDLASIQASGPDGVVHLRDVEGAAAGLPSTPGGVQEGPEGAMRRAIAAAMSRSKREIPHYYLSHTVDLGPALELVRAENERRSVAERLLPVAVLLKATALALRESPALNAHFVDGGAPPLPGVHLGVAIALRGGGLVAPALHDADAMSLTELMQAFKDLVKRTRTGRLRSSELTEATATVTSLGDRGVETVFPVINPPQVAMVGFGRVVERPWVVDGEVRPRPVVTASLAADHRVSDGHQGGLFLATIERLLARPEEL